MLIQTKREDACKGSCFGKGTLAMKIAFAFLLTLAFSINCISIVKADSISELVGLKAGAAAVLEGETERIYQHVESEETGEPDAMIVDAIQNNDATEVLSKEDAYSQVAVITGIPIVPETEKTDGEKIMEDLTENPIDLAHDDPLYELFGNDVIVSDVTDSVNVRDIPSEEGEVVGKLYHNCAGRLLECSESWSLIESGEMQGWVKNDYLVLGQEAVKLARQVGSTMATVNTQTLRVRESADEDGSVIGLLAEGDKIEVVEDQGEWAKVSYSDSSEGYISTEFVSMEYEIDEGESMRQIEERIAREEARKKAEEEAARKAAARKKVEAGRTTKTTTTNNGGVAADADDVTLLAALIQCESGYEPYDGKVAVGTVVVNRAHGRYGSIRNAIYAPGQFGPAASGKVAAVVAAGPRADCVKAAKEALAGTSKIGSATHFRNVRSGYTGIVIGNHVFW